ncbi:ATP-dependent endonuclease [Clostridium botulinum]|nr:ATP-dependent endonuclease [Clostridium botulinum]MCS4456726.1 ATP-dependent endonuclease [Clostridium botulinum]
MVEGDAENILIPTIAKIIDRPLYRYGVSIVNVGNVAFLRYSNIFISKKRDKTIGIPTSIVTDLDVRPIQYYIDKKKDSEYKIYKIKDTGEYFVREDDSKKRVKEILGKDSSERFKNGEYQSQVEIIENDYDKYKEVVREDKKQKYNFKDIKVFTNNWTMEFDLALSCIREELYAAVLIAKNIKADEKIVDRIILDDYIDEAKEEIDQFIKDSKDDMDIAYEIYKPLLKGNASKAVCAQYLSKILLSKSKDNDEFVKAIIKDEYVKYILDAIYHVTNTISEATE